VQPDLFVARHERRELRQRGWPAVQRMALVIEVLSPGSARQDRGKKRELYMRTGVEDYWIVDLDARAVERWMPGRSAAEVVTGPITWTDSAGGPALTIDLRALFDSVFAE
jgi:Uma2 family endonuclease